MTSDTKIEQRIRSALRGGALDYRTLALAVFPPTTFPRAWNYSTSGGPPACYKVLTAAINRYGFCEYTTNSGRRIVCPRPGDLER